jgi:sulfopyruvate decarboxylase subunit beta
MNPEERIVSILKKAGVSMVCALPCDRVKTLHHLLDKEFKHIPLTREEEGVGIVAGASLAGKRAIMLVQSSGLGNMVNALASLALFYELPLFILISWRGFYNETIEAQRHMGTFAPKLLKVLGIEFARISETEDIKKIDDLVKKAFDESRVTAALLSPRIWEESLLVAENRGDLDRTIPHRSSEFAASKAELTRYEVIEGVKDGLRNKAVVCNIGIPCKELYHVLDQPSNFYMLGSMGMATPIGLGMALGSNKDVVVIDGDGSILMNPGILATVAEMNPGNLTILAIDNAVYGSTGNQPTAARGSAHLQMIASGMGIKNTQRAVDVDELHGAMSLGRGPRFIHAVAKPGNAGLKNIPLTPREIKTRVMEFLMK